MPEEIVTVQPEITVICVTPSHCEGVNRAPVSRQTEVIRHQLKKADPLFPNLPTAERRGSAIYRLASYRFDLAFLSQSLIFACSFL